MVTRDGNPFQITVMVSSNARDKESPRNEYKKYLSQKNPYVLVCDPVLGPLFFPKIQY